MGFGIGFGIFLVILILIFLLIIAVFLVILIKGIGRWNQNNHSPRLTVPGAIVSKRTHVSRHHHHRGTGMGMQVTTHPTTYYATFQETRYLGFART